MQNLFMRLMKRTSSEERQQVEDYVTEAWCWLLAHEPGLGDAFAIWLASRGNWTLPIGPFRWHTQRQFTVGSDRSIIDLFAEADGGVLLIEHKVWAPLHDGQMLKYSQLGEARWPGRHRTVLITGRTDQHTQDAHLRLVWPDVASFLDRWLKEHERPVVHAFVEFLVVQGLGPPAPVSYDGLIGWFPAQKLEQSLTELFQRLANDMDLAPLQAVYEVLGVSLALRPTAAVRKWGLLGLDFPSSPMWRPGLTVGVMLECGQYGINPSRPELGPDFVLMVNLHLEPGVPTWDQMVNHPAFSRLRARLANEAGGYVFLDHLLTKDPNKWHPLSLRRPMLNVLRGTRDTNDQFTRTSEEIAAVLTVLLQGGELAEMVRALKASSTDVPS